ncbi:helix-turn-helix domain-containing protein [Providencia sneebia]|uniref:HTH cro/C1-type domain-containing protein n=1 Tax=Providencia sneebia DSM 19967 TaxID=1141660 RepID=K8W9X6_9GAMM|nr:hypothetical protein OO7_08615 [Providencia sneebia DSM 19967]
MKSSRYRNIVLGGYIREVRIARGISTKTMVDILKISEDDYLQYESGEVSMYVEHLLIISGILNINFKVLLNIFENARNNYWM